MFFHSFLFIYFLSFRIFWCAIFMSTSTSMPVIKLDCVRRKMHNNNNNDNNNNDDNDDNNTTTNNNLDCGWTLKLFLTGMWHSLAALLPLRCSLCDAHFVCTYRRMPVVTGDSTTRLLDSPRSLCSGSTWRIPRRLLARATTTSNAMHSRQVPWAVARWPWIVVARGPMCTFALHAFSSQVDGAARCP